MEDREAVVSDIEGEEKLIAAANYLVSELGLNKNLTEGTKKVLSDLLSKLSLVVPIVGNEDEDGVSEIEERLNVASEIIMRWEADGMMIWDSGPDEVNEYLNSVNQVRILIERLENSSFPSKNCKKDELLRKAHDVLQTAMARLEDEFRHMLVQNRLPFEAEHTSFRSSEEDGFLDNEGSIVSSSVDSIEDLALRRDCSSVGRISGEIILDLIRPEVIPDLKRIANAMFAANYDRECTRVYTIARKDALDEFLFSHEMEKMSIEDTLRMDWGSLNSYIKKWVIVMRKVVRIYLVSEKWLSDQILGDQCGVGFTCFVDASKASMMQLLNFGEAVSLGPCQPEKLLRILDMYETAANLVTDVDALFLGDAGLAVRSEYQEVMKRLRDCARLTFLEFKAAIATNTSPILPGGGVHRLTNYVMNYLRALTDYSATLDLLVKEQAVDDDIVPLSPCIADTGMEVDGTDGSYSSRMFPAMTRHFHSIAYVLESNLRKKSRLYRDGALQAFFLMNNVYYMAQKVKNSELQHVFGSIWIRKYNWKYQNLAMEYERATWNSVLPLLKDEGTSGSGSSSRSQNPRDRFQSFFTAFDEVYKTQTAWIAADDRLRDDLGISASLKVIQAYRMFYSGHKNHVSDRHIRYSPDDLEKLLLDLFSGYPKSLNHSHRR